MKSRRPHCLAQLSASPESGRKGARHVARTSPAHYPPWTLCANTQYPSNPSRARRPPRPASLPSFERSHPQPLGDSILIFHALQGFIQRSSWIFEVLFPECQSCLVSSFDAAFTRGIVVFFSCILGCLHFPEGFCFLGILWLLHPLPSPQPYSFISL